MKLTKKQGLIIGFIILFVGAVAIFFFHKKYSSSPEDTFNSNMKSIINCEYDDFRYISLSGEFVDCLANGKVSAVIMQNIDYSYIDVKNEKDAAVVTAKFSYPNVPTILNEISSSNSNISETELIDQLVKTIELGNFPTVDCTAQIPMLRVDGEWYVIESEQFNNIITGGVYLERIKQNEEIYNRLKDMEK